MNQQEMTRWTRPTNEAFYALHKGAIQTYSAIAIVMQAVWLFFSVSPAAQIIHGKLHAYLSESHCFGIALAILLFMHYLLHKLIRYIFYNLLDDDPNTVNSVMHYAVASLIVAVLLMVDIAGIRAFFDETPKIEQADLSNTTSRENAVQGRNAQLKTDLEELKSAETAAIEAAFAKEKPALEKIRMMRVNDAQDMRRRSREIRRIEARRDAAIGQIKEEYALRRTELVASKNADVQKLTEEHALRGRRIGASLESNKQQAHSLSWIISVACLLSLLGCTYQVTILRVKAGQKPISRFTISDATGGFFSKLGDAITDIFERFGHFVVYKLHNAATIRDLDALDGSFKIKGMQYASNAPNDPNNGNTEGGNGGGGSNPTAPTPPTNPSHGATKPQKAEPPADVAVMDIPDGVIVEAKNELYGDTPISALTDAQKVELMKLATAYWNVENQKPVITATETVITENSEADIAVIVSHIKMAIQKLNADCSNYENKNGQAETVIERIRTKRDALVNLFHKNSVAIAPRYAEVVESYEKAAVRAGKILNDYFNTKGFRSE